MGLDVVTGAFSNTGRHIAQRLLGAGRQVHTLTGHPDRPSPFGPRVLALPLQFDEPDRLAASLRGADTLYNTYWVRFPRGGTGHERAVAQTQTLWRAAAAAGVRRVVHISITGADPDSPLSYFRGKGRVEHALRASGLSYAILRPTLIFGPQDVLLHNLAWLARRLPRVPVFGDGRYPVQPVHVEDVADLAVRAGATDQNLERDAVGPETWSYADLVTAIATAVGRRAAVVRLPPGLCWAGAAAIGLLVGDVVVTRDEIAGLMAGLLRSAEPPSGRRLLSDWLRENGSTLGHHWASELRRHYRRGPDARA